jgi:transposase-like protein
MARERRLFSEEFRREAVKLVGQHGAGKAAIARDMALALICWGAGAETRIQMQKSSAVGRRCLTKSVSACGASWRRSRWSAIY